MTDKGAALPQGVEADAVAFSMGHPDRELLPIAELEAAAQAAFRLPDSPALLEYGPEQGMPWLIDYLVDRLNSQEALGLTRSNLMLVAGSTHGVDLAARLFASPAGAVLVESPSYRDALLLFRDQGCHLRSVPMDNEGVSLQSFADAVKSLQSEGKKPSLFYTIPTFQNPTGITTSLERRQAILEIARRHQILILEDDVYRDIVFEGEVPASYFALASGDGVLRIGSFSKTLAPGLRLGWLIGKVAHIERYVGCGTFRMGGGVNPLAAHIAAAYVASGGWDAQIARLRQAYRLRRDVMLAELDRSMPSGVSWTTPAGGFFIWLTLPPEVGVTRLEKLLSQRGVTIAAGTGFFVDPRQGEQHLRLAFSFAPLEALKEGVRILAATIRALADS